MRGVFRRQGGVRGEEFGQFAGGPVEDGHREGAGQGGAAVAQFGSQAGDLGAELGRVVGAEGPDALGVVELVQRDRADVAGVGDHVPVVVGESEEAAHPVPAGQQGRGGRGERGVLRDEQGGRLGEALLGSGQLVVCFEGFRDDFPGRRVRGRGRSDALDEGAGLGLVAVLPQVRRLERLDQVRIGGRGGEELVVQRAGAFPGVTQFEVGRGLEEQGLLVLGVTGRRADEALGFGDVLGRRVRAHGSHRTAAGLLTGEVLRCGPCGITCVWWCRG